MSSWHTGMPHTKKIFVPLNIKSQPISRYEPTTPKQRYESVVVYMLKVRTMLHRPSACNSVNWLAIEDTPGLIILKLSFSHYKLEVNEALALCSHNVCQLQLLLIYWQLTNWRVWHFLPSLVIEYSSHAYTSGFIVGNHTSLGSWICAQHHQVTCNLITLWVPSITHKSIKFLSSTLQLLQHNISAIDPNREIWPSPSFTMCLLIDVWLNQANNFLLFCQASVPGIGMFKLHLQASWGVINQGQVSKFVWRSWNELYSEEWNYA